MKPEDVYPWCIENMKSFIRNQEEPKSNGPPKISVFDAAPILAVAFCKNQTGIIEDLLS